MNPIFYIDFYKVGHVQQYPKGTQKLWVNFTPRSTRVEGETGAVFFGLQRWIKKVLLDEFQENFFDRDWNGIESEYREVIQKTLGVAEPKVDHIRALWKLGYMPIDIYALPEGTYVPVGVPAMVITNTHPDFFWLPNYLETTMSANIWPACTSASTARRFRKIFEKHALAAGESDLSFIDWQGHDFAYRGLMGEEAAAISGMGHLTSFSGTDTIPAIFEAVKYYNADFSVGGSVPATEHSVMCAGGEGNELETFRRLIEDIYPTGIVSIVSDTWDLWKVLIEYIPALKDKILARDGKIVIRPDSGDPVKILTGDPDALWGSAAYQGALRLLSWGLGTDGNLKRAHINKGGLIYGDGISPERVERILTNARAQGFSPYNIVFGIGSYTYQYVTRDTYNFAFKATAVKMEGEDVKAIFKAPVTDNFSKKSHRGIPVVYRGRVGQGDVAGKLYVEESLNPADLDRSEFRKVLECGFLAIDEKFETIRARVRS